MRIRLEVGTKEIAIDSYVDEDEDNISWPVVLDTLVWPALRAWGFILDQEFTDNVPEYHQQWLAEEMAYKKAKEDLEE